LSLATGQFVTCRLSSKEVLPILPTVCLILKAPRIGEVKSRLAKDIGAREAAGVYRALAERQAAEIPSNWPVAVYFAPADAEAEMRLWLQPHLPAKKRFAPQRAGDLGQRLAAALDSEFANGSTKVFLIGGDCPDLDRRYLLEASLALEANDLVIGPAVDGGYVLIGLKRDSHDRHHALFKNIAWSSSAVLEQTLAASREQRFSVALLRPLADIDDLPSLRNYPDLMKIAESPR
jgi:uncharacterized protein